MIAWASENGQASSGDIASGLVVEGCGLSPRPLTNESGKAGALDAGFCFCGWVGVTVGREVGDGHQCEALHSDGTEVSDEDERWQHATLDDRKLVLVVNREVRHLANIDDFPE